MILHSAGDLFLQAGMLQAIDNAAMLAIQSANSNTFDVDGHTFTYVSHRAGGVLVDQFDGKPARAYRLSVDNDSANVVVFAGADVEFARRGPLPPLALNYDLRPYICQRKPAPVTEASREVVCATGVFVNLETGKRVTWDASNPPPELVAAVRANKPFFVAKYDGSTGEVWRHLENATSLFANETIAPAGLLFIRATVARVSRLRGTDGAMTFFSNSSEASASSPPPPSFPGTATPNI